MTAIAIVCFILFVIALVVVYAIALSASVSECPACKEKALYSMPDFMPDYMMGVMPILYKCEACGVLGTYEDLTSAKEKRDAENASATTQ